MAPIRLGTTVILSLSIVSAVAIAQSISERAKRDDITIVPDSDPDMAEAFRKARATLPGFLALAKSPPPGTTGFAVKVAIRDSRNTEYFWINPFAEHGGYFSGPIDNEPRLVTNVQLDQVWKFKQSEIVDWTYLDMTKRRSFGNFTTCAMLKHEPVAEAEKLRKTYGLVCDG
jgi:uncharacterized protein YegJ (DUF2314 family)